MLNQYLVEKLASEQKIAPLNIIREYYEMEILHYLSQSPLSKNVVFYGGTALRLAYRSFRFSEDLDFLLCKKGKKDKAELTKTLEAVVAADNSADLEEVVDKRQTLFGLLHLQSSFLKHPLRIKIEISKKKNGLQDENILLNSPLSSREVIFRTASLKSLHQLKKKAIVNRDMPRDWFDYWYLCQKLDRPSGMKREFPFARTEFARELKRWLPRDRWPIIETVVKFFN